MIEQEPPTLSEDEAPCCECGEPVGHHAACPVETNWWTIRFDTMARCGLCKRLMTPGTLYRIIPCLPEDEELDPEQTEPIVQRHETMPVCGQCCLLRAVPAFGGVVLPE